MILMISITWHSESPKILSVSLISAVVFAWLVFDMAMGCMQLALIHLQILIHFISWRNMAGDREWNERKWNEMKWEEMRWNEKKAKAASSQQPASNTFTNTTSSTWCPIHLAIKNQSQIKILFIISLKKLFPTLQLFGCGLLITSPHYSVSNIFCLLIQTKTKPHSCNLLCKCPHISLWFTGS